jgi:hypothetical protein
VCRGVDTVGRGGDYMKEGRGKRLGGGDTTGRREG